MDFEWNLKDVMGSEDKTKQNKTCVLSPQSPPPPRATALPPHNPHTFHKTRCTSGTQSGVLLDSVNSPDGDLNKSYNEALNDGETEVAKVSEQ